MSACVSPPHESVSHMVHPAASMALAASTALPPLANTSAPAVAESAAAEVYRGSDEVALIEAFQVTGDTSFGRAARQCLEFVEREMTSPEGGFYSAQDADTRGEEGGYYLWTRKEIEELLPGDVFPVAADAWHLTTAGNFIDPVTGDRTGKNVIYLTRAPDDLARQKESRVLEGHLQPDHVHMLISIPPKYAVSEFMGYLKGKMALRLFQQYESLGRRYRGRHLWARGYCVSIIGLDEEKIMKYATQREG